jgi:hypothetical protein
LTEKVNFILPFGLGPDFILPFGLGPDFILPSQDFLGQVNTVSYARPLIMKRSSYDRFGVALGYMYSTAFGSLAAWLRLRV